MTPMTVPVPLAPSKRTSQGLPLVPPGKPVQAIRIWYWLCWVVLLKQETGMSAVEG